jgi:hypothetical protein
VPERPSGGLIQLTPAQSARALPAVGAARLAPADRARLERRARLLAWGGIGWHLVEFAIAIFAGVAAGSIALIGFGADSLIEAVAGFVVVWLFVGSASASRRSRRRRCRCLRSSSVESANSSARRRR